ncbi:MAG: hypothetical protein JRI34_03265 [Deltaproteobacteria bacterium]|nr:hypothetical protein [Deltaproteobacteria bacterium]
MKFKGFDGWIEIFRGGKQVDSAGREHEGDEIIDKAVATFDAAEHEPPLVVGHPKENAPSFGWVEALKTTVKDGVKVLLARAKQVVPEFEEMVKQGRYKKRSASFYPDGRLRHVGFLGAAPPAVKGLADLKFEDSEEAITFDFSDEGLSVIGGIFRRLRDWLIEKEGKDQADAIIPDWDVEYIREEANKKETITGDVPAFSAVKDGIDDRKPATTQEEKKMSNFKEKLKNFLGFMGVDMSKVPDDALPDSAPEGTSPDGFTEADLEKARTEAKAEAKREVDAEYAEKEQKKRKDAREKEISEFCDPEKKKVVPRWIDMGIKEFMESLDGEEVMEFSEGKKTSRLDWFKGFMEDLPKLVEFKEIATRDDDVQTGDAAQKLEKMTRKKMAENKDLDYTAAFSEVQKEHPDLATEYQQEMTKG